MVMGIIYFIFIKHKGLLIQNYLKPNGSIYSLFQN